MSTDARPLVEEVASERTRILEASDHALAVIDAAGTSIQCGLEHADLSRWLRLLTQIADALARTLDERDAAQKSHGETFLKLRRTDERACMAEEERDHLLRSAVTERASREATEAADLAARSNLTAEAARLRARLAHARIYEVGRWTIAAIRPGVWSVMDCSNEHRPAVTADGRVVTPRDFPSFGPFCAATQFATADEAFAALAIADPSTRST
jgi:hypothetical protein